MSKGAAPQETSKKFRSKGFFRVAVEGDTIDGRKIERQQIQDMADTYDPSVYGARIWLEHLRGLIPDSTFGAYGDVTAVKAEEVDFGGQKRLALFAQIDALPSLVEVNKKGQKIYTSVEIQPNFANSGKAYLGGLGITDSPASLGTDKLKFSSKLAGLTFGESPEHLFSTAIEAALELEEVQDGGGYVSGLFSKISGVFKKQAEKQDADSQQAFAEVEQSLTEIAQHVVGQAQQFSELESKHSTLKQAHDELLGKFNALEQKLGGEPSGSQRPPATNSQFRELVDC